MGTREIVFRIKAGGVAPDVHIAFKSTSETYGGFTPGRVVYGKTPKMPIGTVDNPKFNDFGNHGNEPPTLKDLVVRIQKIQK